MGRFLGCRLNHMSHPDIFSLLQQDKKARLLWFHRRHRDDLLNQKVGKNERRPK